MAKRKFPEKKGNDIYGVKSNLSRKFRIDDTGETGFRHSNYYHKYFHGYTEVRMAKPDGKYEIRRVYTAPWLVQDVLDERRILIRLLYLLNTVCSALLYIWLMSRPGFSGNTSRLVALPGFSALICLFLQFVSVISYVCTKRRMTWWEQYSGSAKVKNFSLATSVCLILTGVMMLVNIAVSGAAVGKEGLLAAGVWICGGVDFIVYRVEKGMPYREEKNDVILPEGEIHQIL